MSFGSNPTTGTQGTLPANQFPISTVATPNTANGDLTATEGGPVSTDTNNNKTAPVSVYTYDGKNVTVGATTDAAGANTVMGQLKQIKTNTSTLPAGTNVIGHVVVDSAGNVGVTSLPSLPAGTNVIGHIIVDSGALTVSSLPALPAGSNLIGNVELVDAAGTNKAAISAAGAMKVDNSGVTQPVSAASLPLPTGAAQEAGHLATIDSHIPAQGQATMAASLPVVIASNQTAIPVSGSITATNPSVGTDGSAIPLSSTLLGASDGTNLQQLLVESASNRNLRTGIYSGTNEATVTGANALKVDGSAVTQPVSGNVSVTSLPTLPSGTNLIGSVELVDSAGTNKASISAGGAVKVDNSAVTQPVSAASLPLPSGASTSAKQPALGTAGAASSDVLSVQGIASMTPLTVNATLQSGGNLYGSTQITGNDSSSKLKVNGDGTLPVVQTDQNTSGTITAALQSIQFDLKDAVGTIEFFLAGTFSAGSTIVFEQSADNTNWLSIFGRVTGSATVEPISTLTGPGPIAVLCNGVSAAHVRARCTVFQAGDSINVTIRSSVGTTAVSIDHSLPPGAATIGGVTIQATSGTALIADQSNTELRVSNYGKSATAGDTAFKVNAVGDLYMLGDFTEVAGAGVGVVTGINTDFIAATDVSAYKWFSIQLAGTFNLTLTVQVSNDNTNWANQNVYSASSGGTFSPSLSSAGVFHGPVIARYIRIRCTIFTSNTSLSGNAEFYTEATAAGVSSVNQNGTWTVGLSATDVTLIASAAFTTTQTTADQTNTAAKGIRVVLDMTTPGTGSVTLAIQAKDVASGKYVALLTGTAVTTTSTNVYVVYPGLTPSANAIVSDVLPHTWRVVVTANNANSCTYSVGASYLL